LKGRLEGRRASRVVAVNGAVAGGVVQGPEAGLELIDELGASGDLDNCHLLHAARAALLRRLGSMPEAARSYARALELVTNESERRFLERRLSEVRPAGSDS